MCIKQVINQANVSSSAETTSEICTLSSERVAGAHPRNDRNEALTHVQPARGIVRAAIVRAPCEKRTPQSG